MTAAIHGRFDSGFGWIAHPGEFMERSSTALLDDGHVWLIDPVRGDGVDEAIAALGKVAGIILTLPRHDRDTVWFAALHNATVYVPRRYGDIRVAAQVEYVDQAIPGSALRVLDVSTGPFELWRECAVWWPQHRTLVVGDLLGTAAYFLREGETLAVHPLARLMPPRKLRGLGPERIYPGHGPSVTSGAAAAMERALVTSVSGSLAAYGRSIQVVRQRRREGRGC